MIEIEANKPFILIVDSKPNLVQIDFELDHYRNNDVRNPIYKYKLRFI